MTPIEVAVVSLVATFSCAMIGTAVRSVMPEAHRSKESQDVVRLGMGLVATMTALLLGLITAAAKSAFDARDLGIRAGATNILTLDRHLAEYGPSAGPIRDLLKRSVAQRIQMLWPDTGASLGFGETKGVSPVENIQNQVLALVPANDAQRWWRSECLGLTEQLLRERWRSSDFTTRSVSPLFLTVVIFWLGATFFSFGLYAPRNATVVGVFLIATASVAAAVFLILELDGPFEGLIKVSSEAWRYALAHLGT